MSEAWKQHDRPCPPCPHCGAELYEKFWGNGGWVPSDVGTDHAHGNCIRVVVRERDRMRLMLGALKAWCSRNGHTYAEKLAMHGLGELPTPPDDPQETPADPAALPSPAFSGYGR
jgi:hypothetical protein